MKVTMLGCGTSVGVPALGKAGWGACDPQIRVTVGSAVRCWCRVKPQIFWLMQGRISATSFCRSIWTGLMRC